MASTCVGYGQEALDTARETYQKHCREIVAVHDKRDGESATAYRQSLQRLLASTRKAGDLDGWQAVKAEIERFERSSTLEESHFVSNVSSLKALQAAFRDARRRSGSERSRAIVSLAEKYAAHLKKLEKEYTKAGAMEDALACRAEARRAADSPLVSAAQFEIAASEADDRSQQDDRSLQETKAPKGKRKGKGKGKGKGRGKVPEVEPSAEDTQPASDGDAPRTIGGCMVHSEKTVDTGGVFFRRLTLRPSSRGRVARRVSVQAESGDLSESSSGSSSHSYLSYYYSYYYGKSKSESTDTMVRMRVRAAQEVSDISVVIQLFTKPVGVPGNVAPSRADIYRIPLERLGREWLTIDCPPVSTSKSRSRSSYYSSTRKSGRDFFGLAVTVLDAEGGLLFEGVSSPALTDFAEGITNEPSREEIATKLRTEYELTRKQYYEAVSGMSREPGNAKLRAARSRALKAYNRAREAYEAALGHPVTSEVTPRVIVR